MPNRKATPSARKSQAVPLSRKRKPRQIEDLRIPATFQLGIAQGIVPTSQNVKPVAVRGNVETLKGVAVFEEAGIDWLACPVTLTVNYDWKKLRKI